MDCAYWYEGCCPRTGEILRLPRSPEAEAIARELMQDLAQDGRYAREGKMYGILLVETDAGSRQVLKAFSGLLQGESQVAGWVPPIPGREQVALEEARTLRILADLKQALIDRQQIPERQQYDDLNQEFTAQWQQLTAAQAQRKQERQHLRQQYLHSLTGTALEAALEALDNQSRRDGTARRQFKQQWQARLWPLQQRIEQVDAEIRAIKQQRREYSRQLQAQMHTHYRLTNFAGETVFLQNLMPGGSMPTGTGDCCAPKLLHYAASQGWTPLAMAEFWWGPSTTSGDRVQGEFYGACADRCQPLMGFLLGGAQATPDREANGIPSWPNPLSILYRDRALIAVDKPSGLLAVPGRTSDRQDSVLSRLRLSLPDGENWFPVHRLDQDTSGVLLLAHGVENYRQLSQQFQKRQVKKVYEAILAGMVAQAKGTIDLPLASDPDDRPRQRVDWQQGKPSLTHFQVMGPEAGFTRVAFFPVTGRTHQIRVHAAHLQGLGVPIWGDRLYGVSQKGSRLHLHARELTVRHPESGEWLHLTTPTPF